MGFFLQEVAENLEIINDDFDKRDSSDLSRLSMFGESNS